MVFKKEVGATHHSQTVDKIERTCFQIAKSLLSDFITDPTDQREIAYAIVVMARKSQAIREPDRALLRTHLNIYVKKEGRFRETLEVINSRIEQDPYNLNFDLVVRKYDKEGNELNDECGYEEVNLELDEHPSRFRCQDSNNRISTLINLPREHLAKPALTLFQTTGKTTVVNLDESGEMESQISLEEDWSTPIEPKVEHLTMYNSISTFGPRIKPSKH